jgi:hypothetical protein
MFQIPCLLSDVGTWSRIVRLSIKASAMESKLLPVHHHPTRTPYALRNAHYALRPTPCSLQACRPAPQGPASCSSWPNQAKVRLSKHHQSRSMRACSFMPMIAIRFRTSSAADELSIHPSIVFMRGLSRLSVCESWRAIPRCRQSSAPSHPHFRRSVVSLHSETWRL